MFPPTRSFPKALHLSGGMPASGLDWQNSASFSRLDFKFHKGMAGLSQARDFFSFDPRQGFPVLTRLPAEWYCLLALCPDTSSLLCLFFTVISLYSSKTSQSLHSFQTLATCRLCEFHQGSEDNNGATAAADGDDGGGSMGTLLSGQLSTLPASIPSSVL